MIGQIIRDRYRVLDAIGDDRLATSYLARDQTQNGMVVLKIIRAELGADDSLLDGLRNQAEKLGSLVSPQAVKILDCGRAEAGLYAVFEYAGEKKLADLLRPGGRLSVEQTLDVARQVGLCLLDAHAHGLVHGDLRPANILMLGEGQLKLVGFGLAQALDLGQLLAGRVLEEEEYDAPELAAGAALDARADLFALGVTLFEMLTAQRPPRADHLPDAGRPSRLRPELPPGLDDLVARCLASDPLDRPQSAAEFLEGVDESLRAIAAAARRGLVGIEDALTGHMLGAYRLVDKLGRGGMATVYKAYEPALDRYVAVKVLPQQFAQDAEFLARFRREAKAIARLNHPNIVPVFNFGEEGELAYIVMRYVEGGTLKNLLGRPMPPARAARLALPVARALSYAHRQGVVHRDVKPANVLLAEGDWPLLSDFGLARMMGSSVQLTQTGVGVGTPVYMSPEQGQGLAVDGRSDVYSLGIVLYEMLTGQVPFQADTPLAIVLKHISAPLPMPRQVNPGIPESLERIILKATAKDPTHRYQSADELVEALDQALVGLPPVPAEAAVGDTLVPPAPPSAVTQPPTVAGSEIPAATTVLAPPAARRRVPAWALGLIGVLLVATVLVGLVAARRLALNRRQAARATATALIQAGASPAPAAQPSPSPRPPLPRPVSAGQPPRDAREVRPCQSEGRGAGLCIFPLSGGEARRILADQALEITSIPSWSPDGQRIAFSAVKPGEDPDSDSDIYVVNADGTHLTELPQAGNDVFPSWSPDWNWLAFHSSGDLVIRGPDGSNPIALLRSQGRGCVLGPQWSPDSQRIVVSVQIGRCHWGIPMTREVRVVSRDGEPFATLGTFTHQDEACIRPEVAFSPDGRQVAYFDGQCQAWLARADGSGQPVPLEEFPNWWTAVVTPQWGRPGQAPPSEPAPPTAPAGKIVELCESPPPQQICVRDAQTNQVTRLTQDLEFEAFHRLAWSPYGQYILFDGGSDADHKLYLVRADGTGLTQLTQGTTNDLKASWSPDGEEIAFHRNCDLWLVRPDGSQPRRLLKRSEVFCASRPAWSPDSRQIALVNGPEDEAVRDEVRVVPRYGGAQRVVYTFEQPIDWASVAWSPDGQRLAVWYSDGQRERGLVIDPTGQAEPRPIEPGDNIRSWFPDFWPQWGAEVKAIQPTPGAQTAVVGESVESQAAPADAWGQVVVPPGQAIRLAFVGDLSGEAVGIGQVERNGVLMAIEDLAAVHGFPLGEPAIADGGCTQQDLGRQAAQAIAADPAVVGVIGHTCSASCAQTLPIYQDARLVTISPSCTQPDLSAQGYAVFNRVAIRDDQGSDELNAQVVETAPYQDFVRRYQERFGQSLQEVDYGPYAAYAYGAAAILIQALEAVGVVDGEGNLVIGRAALAEAVRATPRYPGITGPIRFDERGDRLPP